METTTLYPSTCHTCGTETGEMVLATDLEYADYCRPCRSAMVLPCDCGGEYDRDRGYGLPPYCWSCGSICAYYDDSDLVDPEG